MGMIRVKLPKLKRRRRYMPVSRITPKILSTQTVDIVFEILTPTIQNTTATVIDIIFQPMTPTLVFSPYVIEVPVIDIVFEIVSYDIIRIMQVVDIVLQLFPATLYYPIVITPLTLDIVFEIPQFSKAISPPVTDIVFEILLPFTGTQSVTATVVDILFDIRSDIEILYSGFFFCVDAGQITAPGCWEGLILDGIAATGKINCGE